MPLFVEFDTGAGDINNGNYPSHVIPLSDGYFFTYYDGSTTSGAYAIAYRLDVVGGTPTVTQVDTAAMYNSPNSGRYWGLAQSAPNHVVAVHVEPGNEQLWGFRFDPSTETLTSVENTGYSAPAYSSGTRNRYTWNWGAQWSDGVGVVGYPYSLSGFLHYYAAHWIAWKSGDAQPVLQDFQDSGSGTYAGEGFIDQRYDFYGGSQFVLKNANQPWDVVEVTPSGFTTVATGWNPPNSPTYAAPSFVDGVVYYHTSGGSDFVFRSFDGTTETTLGSINFTGNNFPSNPVPLGEEFYYTCVGTDILGNGSGIDGFAIVKCDDLTVAYHNASASGFWDYGAQAWLEPITAGGLKWKTFLYDDYTGFGRRKFVLASYSDGLDFLRFKQRDDALGLRRSGSAGAPVPPPSSSTR